MRNLLKFLMIVGVVLVGSALLTPVIHSLLPFVKFARVFRRLVLIFTILAVVLFVRFDRNAWREYGFHFRAPWKRLVAYGFISGALMVIIVAAVETLWGPRFLRENMNAPDMIRRFFGGLTTGAAVGIIEEFFFRGFVFSRLERIMKIPLAVIVTSFFYALVHFLDDGRHAISDHPGLRDAFGLILGHLEPILHQPMHILPEFAGLFIFGVALSGAFIRSRSLFLSIGAHAGVVFLIKFQNAFLRSGPAEYLAVYGNAPLYDGPFEWLMLIVLGFGLYYLVPRVKKG